MSFTPTSGLNCVVSLETTGASNLALAGTNWSIAVDPKAKDVSNFKTGRLRIGTLLDAVLTFQLVWDTATPPVTQAGVGSAPAGLYAGAYITVYCFSNVSVTPKYFTVTGIITKATPSLASIEDALLYDIEVSLSAFSTAVTFINQTQFSYPA